MPDTLETLRLLEKLRRIEALCARPGSEGERLAAEGARRQILAQLAASQESPPPPPPKTPQPPPRYCYKFSFGDPWGRELFFALLRRHGLKPLSSRGRKSVQVEMTTTFLESTFRPEFEALQRSLYTRFDEFTAKTIAGMGSERRPP